MYWVKAFIIYVIAFIVVAVVNIDKISLWADEEFKGQNGSPVFKVVRKVKRAYRTSSVADYSAGFDCLLSRAFNDNYKSSLDCPGDKLWPDKTAAAAAREAYERLNHPELKGLRPIDQDELIAALKIPDPVSIPYPGPMQPVITPEPESAPEPMQPVIVPAKLEGPHRILVVGDSLAIGLALSLRRAVVSYKDIVLIDEGKVSSGLANPRYYNWEKALTKFIDKYNPNIVVVMMGANDAKYIKLNEKPRPPDAKNKSWPQVFSDRVERFLNILNEKGILNYWVGLPVMGDPTYAKQARAMNDIIIAECGKFASSRYLDTWPVLTDENGEYASFLRDEDGRKHKVRANDKIHFSVHGGDFLARHFFKSIAKDVALSPKKDAAESTVQ